MTCSSAWARRSVNRNPAMRVPVGVSTGSLRVVNASVTRIGLWLSR